MPVPAPADLPQSDSLAADARPDARQRQLALLVRAVAVGALIVGVPHAAARRRVRGPARVRARRDGDWLRAAGSNPSRATSAPRNAQARSPGSPTSRSVVIGAAAVLQPSIARGDGDRRAAAGRRDAAVPRPAARSAASWSLAGFVGIGSVLAAEIVPVSDQIPAHFLSALGLITLMIAFGLLLVAMLEVSRRMTSTAEDLRSVVAMSNDLSRTMDPQLVGDRIARHIARAVGANDCALSYWDRPGDRLVTLGYFPLDRRERAPAGLPAGRLPGDAAGPRQRPLDDHRHRRPRRRPPRGHATCARSASGA